MSFLCILRRHSTPGCWQEGLTSAGMSAPPPEDICVLCVGVGAVCEQLGPQCQLACALALAEDLLGVKDPACIHVVDPVFTTEDVEVLHDKLGLSVYAVGLDQPLSVCPSGKVPFLFMPHCPSTLYEAVLLHYWTQQPTPFLMMGNTLTTLAIRKPEDMLRQEYPFLAMVRVHSLSPSTHHPSVKCAL